MPLPVPLSAPGICAPSFNALMPGPSPTPLSAARLFWFISLSAVVLPGSWVGASLVGSRTKESGEVSLVLTAAWRASAAKTRGAGRTTGFGGGGGLTLFFLWGTLLAGALLR